MIASIKKEPAQTLPVYEIKITLRGSNPAIWRRVQVPSRINLNRLHDIFQVVMGWTDSHLHQFVDAPIICSVPSGDDYSRVERLDERRFRLADVARHEKASFLYEYDFGDSWTHEVVVEKILSTDPKKKYAVCLDGENACPPKTPADGNPMEEYLYRRQVTAHFYTWHRFAAAWSGSLPVIGPIFSAVEQDSVENLGSGSGRLAAAVQLHSHAGGAQAGYRPR